MNCPNHKEQELNRVYYCKYLKVSVPNLLSNKRSSNRYPLTTFLYCEIGDEMFRINLTNVESRQKTKK